MTSYRMWRLSAVVATVMFSATPVLSQTLFTTVDDFTDWSASVTQDTVDLDGSATNGLAEGGGAGTPGSLAILPSSNFAYHFSDGQQGNVPLIQSLRLAGDIVFDHDFPTPLQAGSYFQLGAVFNYDGHFDQYFGSTVDNLDGTYTTTVPYEFSPGDLASYLQIGIIYNAELSGVAVTVDNIRIENAVPEPAAVATTLLGLAGLGLIWRRRR